MRLVVRATAKHSIASTAVHRHDRSMAQPVRKLVEKGFLENVTIGELVPRLFRETSGCWMIRCYTLGVSELAEAIDQPPSSTNPDRSESPAAVFLPG